MDVKSALVVLCVLPLYAVAQPTGETAKTDWMAEINSDLYMVEDYLDGLNRLGSKPTSASEKLEPTKYATKPGRERISGDALESDAMAEINTGKKVGKAKYATKLDGGQISGGGETVEHDVRGGINTDKKTDLMKDHLDGLEELKKTPKSENQKLLKTKYATKLDREQMSGGGETMESDVRGGINTDKKTDLMKDHLDGLEELKKTPKSVNQKLLKTKYPTKLDRERISGGDSLQYDVMAEINMDKEIIKAKYATKLARERMSGGGETVEPEVRGGMNSDKKMDLMEDHLDELEERKKTPESVNQKLLKTKYATKLDGGQISGAVDLDEMDELKSFEETDMTEDNLDVLEELEENPKSVDEKLEETKYPTNLSAGGETLESRVLAEIDSDEKFDLLEDNLDGLEELDRKPKSLNQKSGKTKLAKDRLSGGVERRTDDDTKVIPLSKNHRYRSIKKIYNIGDSVLTLDITDLTRFEKMGGTPERRDNPNALKTNDELMKHIKSQRLPVIKVDIKQKPRRLL